MKRPAKRTKNPKGGLTAAGRAVFRRKEGARLKPGVKKRESGMSLSEMRRKGSWAVRFYGRAGKLPALKDKDGALTRFALTAAAWGEARSEDGHCGSANRRQRAAASQAFRNRTGRCSQYSEQGIPELFEVVFQSSE